MAVSFYFFLVLAAVYSAANSLPRQRDVLIVGGDVVDITEYPYQVLIKFKGFVLCGGSIISDEHILTGAQCISRFEPEKLLVKVGTGNVDEGGVELKVKNKFVHPKYENGKLDYDFGVLQVTEKIPINNETMKIVQMADSGSSLKPGDNIVVTGWGFIQESGPDSKELRAVAVPVITNEKCQKAYKPIEVTERMLCAGLPEGGKDACNGDAGGPAVSEGDHVQYGIVSWGVGCARGEYPGVYSNIPAGRDWIKQVSGV